MTAPLIGVAVDDLFIADHTHEGLREGAYSIAYEGAADWPYQLMSAADAGTADTPAGWWLEPGACWYLAAYPDPNMHKCERCRRVVDESRFDIDCGLCDGCTDYNASRVVI